MGRLLPARNSLYPFRIAARIFGSWISRSSCASSGESFGTMVMARPETLNSTWSPSLKPALRRTLVGTVISVLRVTVMVMVAVSLLFLPSVGRTFDYVKSASPRTRRSAKEPAQLAGLNMCSVHILLTLHILHSVVWL